jgi:hypothetical protein
MPVAVDLALRFLEVGEGFARQWQERGLLDFAEELADLLLRGAVDELT